MMFDVRDGTQVRFWHDKWSGHYSLKDLYPNQYASTVDSDASVYSVLDSQLDGGNAVGT